MSRSVAKYALCVLALLTLVDMRRRRGRKRSARLQHKEALRTWEDEGGAVL
jgi:hypothetical protein